MKEIKIIAMDFDGTLLTSDKQISNRTQECLIKAKDMSYIIIGVTARNLLSVNGTIAITINFCQGKSTIYFLISLIQ